MLGKNPPFITSDTLNLDLDLIGLEIVLKARLELNVVLLGGVPVVGSGLAWADSVGCPRGLAPASGTICMRKSVPAWGLLTVIMSFIMSISSWGELEGIDKSGRLDRVEEELSGVTVERRIEKEVGDERVGEGGVLCCCCWCCCC